VAQVAGYEDKCVECRQTIHEDELCCYTSNRIVNGYELWQDGKHITCCKTHVDGVKTPLDIKLPTPK
jgi:hypothetical protein